MMNSIIQKLKFYILKSCNIKKLYSNILVEYNQNIYNLYYNKYLGLKHSIRDNDIAIYLYDMADRHNVIEVSTLPLEKLGILAEALIQVSISEELIHKSIHDAPLDINNEVMLNS